MGRSGLTLAWLLCCAGLYASAAFQDIKCNLMGWNPEAVGALILGYTLMTICLVLVSILTIEIKGPASIGLTFFCAVVLLAVALDSLTAEKLHNNGWLASRTTQSPLWYRISRSVFLAMPAIVWISAWCHRRKTALLQATPTK